MSEFESIAIITGNNGEPDEVWVAVLRYINGAWVRFIERFTSRDFNPDTLYDAWFVDGGTQGTISTFDADIPAVLGDYPTLRATTNQADLGLTKTIAISNVTDLQNMQNNLTGNYYLTGDIDASATSGWNGGLGFAPVGNFAGTLEGDGYTVSGLYIDRPATSNIGLFSNVRATGKVANLTLSDCDITGYSAVGALAGYIFGRAAGDPIIQNCHSSGAIKIGNTGGSSFGGLIGKADGNSVLDYKTYIYDSSSSCNITESVAGDHVDIGGLVGEIEYGIVQNSYATGSVTCGAGCDLVGGFAGDIGADSNIDYSYATGNVQGNSLIGGFTGRMSVNTAGEISKCYSTGNVTAVGTTPNSVGGFIGELLSGTIQNCYSWGNVTSTSAGSTGGGFIDESAVDTDIKYCYSIGSVNVVGADGGFIQNQAGDGSNVVDCYWDIEASGNTSSDAGEAQVTEWLKTNPNYPVGWDFDTIWFQTYTAGTIGNGLETTPIDYSHLEGETVNILADGVKYPQQTVSGGAIDDTEFSDATTVTVGLPVKYIVQPMELNLNQLAHIPQKNLTHLIVKLYQSLSGTYGPDDSNLDPIIYSRTNFDAGPDLFSGTERLVFDGRWESAGDIWIEDNDPLPMTLGSIGVKLGYEND